MVTKEQVNALEELVRNANMVVLVIGTENKKAGLGRDMQMLLADALQHFAKIVPENG